jgi:hypothetical protein
MTGELSDQRQSATQCALLITAFAVFGGVIASSQLALGPVARQWLLCGAIALVIGDLFAVGHMAQLRSRPLQMLILVTCSVVFPFLLGFVSMLSLTTADGASYQWQAILFTAAVMWPMFTIFGLATRLRFNTAIRPSELDADLQYVRRLLAGLGTNTRLTREHQRIAQSLARRLATVATLEQSAKLSALNATADTIRASINSTDLVTADHILLRYGQRHNIGLLDQLIAASAFISIVVTFGKWSAIPLAIGLSNVEFLAFVIDLRLLVLAAIAVYLGSLAVVRVSRTARPIPPRLKPWQIAVSRVAHGERRLGRAVLISLTNALNGLFELLTLLVNSVVYIAWVLGTWIVRVFRNIARLIWESITKKGTLRLIAYTCITFLSFSVLGAMLAVFGHDVVAVITSETGLEGLTTDALSLYRAPSMFFVAAVAVMVISSLLLNVLFDQASVWAEKQLNDLLLGLVPVAVSLPIAGFVLWVVERVFPSSRLAGFKSLGLLTSVGIGLVGVYTLAIGYKAFGRRSA